jgi:hypothetical protein
MRALNEVGAMVQKAALGAGIPLGQAEDLGRVAVYLAGTNGELRAITHALAEPILPLDLQWDSDQITIASGPVAIAGPVIRDAFAMGVQRAVLADTAHVPLVTAILAQSGVQVQVSGTTLTRNGTPDAATPRGPVAISDDVWGAWEALAAKTYVPQSDASRAAGAGAGLTDND